MQYALKSEYSGFRREGPHIRLEVKFSAVEVK